MRGEEEKKDKGKEGKRRKRKEKEEQIGDQIAKQKKVRAHLFSLRRRHFWTNRKYAI